MSDDIQRKVMCLEAFIDVEIFLNDKEIEDLKDDYSQGYLGRLHGKASAYEAVRAEMVHLGLIEGVKDD